MAKIEKATDKKTISQENAEIKNHLVVLNGEMKSISEKDFAFLVDVKLATSENLLLVVNTPAEAEAFAKGVEYGKASMARIARPSAGPRAPREDGKRGPGRPPMTEEQKAEARVKREDAKTASQKQVEAQKAADAVKASDVPANTEQALADALATV